MQIAQELSGYSLGGADLLRRAMGKKIKSEMDAQQAAFVEGAEARGVARAKASQIFEQVAKFAGYGFNKSHAAAYAVVAYQTAWLKANYPVEFFAASMTLDLGNTDKLNVFRQELGRLGIKLLAPDVNCSRATFSVETLEDGSGAIRYALAAVRNVGQGAVETLVRERDARGRFGSLSDLAGRLDGRALNKRQLENLVCAGALDGLNRNRRQTFEAIESILRQANAAASERDSAQVNLFGALDQGGGPSISLPAIGDWPIMERLHKEFEAIGFYLSAHPLDAYGQSLRRLDVVRYGDLARWFAGRTGSRAKLAGIVISRQERTSAKGNRFAFVQLSDTSGMFEALVFADTLAAARDLLEPGRIVLLAADVRAEEDSFRLTVQQVQPLDDAVAQSGAGLRIYLRDPEPVASLKALIQRERRGKGKITFVLDLEDGREVEVALKETYAVSAPTRAAIKAVPGIVEVQDL